MFLGPLFLLLGGATALAAQDLPNTDYVPLDVKGKYLYSVDQMFSFPRLLSIAIRAGVDQGTDTPIQWGGGTAGYAERFASHFGRSFLRENIAFGVRALDHEDPRYFVLGKGGLWKRTKYAVRQTFVVRNDHGSTMPAYSRFISTYSMPLISQAWRPEQFSVGRELGNGSIGMATGVGYNVFQEFWPDLKKKVLKK